MCNDPVVKESTVFLKTWKKGGVDVAERAKGSTTVHQAREQLGCTRACRPCKGF